MAVDVAVLRAKLQLEGVDQAQGKLKGFQGVLQRNAQGLRTAGVALTAIGAAITGIGFLSVRAASDAEEMRSKFDVVFGNLSDSVGDWAATQSKAMNRSRFDFIKYLATLQDTFVPMGIARDQAAKLSKQLVELAVDVGSFNNVASGTVVRDFQSALVGNTETVRKYGVVILESNTKQEAYRMGLAEVGSELTEQAKLQARLSLLVKGTTDAQGDAMRTAGSFANQMAGLKAQIGELAVTIGQVLIPMLLPLIQKITGLAQRIGAWAREHPQLTKFIIIATATLGGLAAVIGPLLLLLPSLAAGIALVAGVGAAVLLPLTAAVVAITAFTAAYTTNFLGIRDITNKVVKFIVGLYKSWVGWLLPSGIMIKSIVLLATKWKSILNDILRATEATVNGIIRALNRLPFVKLGEVELPRLEEEFTKVSEAMRLMAQRSSYLRRGTSGVVNIVTDLEKGIGTLTGSYDIMNGRLASLVGGTFGFKDVLAQTSGEADRLKASMENLEAPVSGLLSKFTSLAGIIQSLDIAAGVATIAGRFGIGGDEFRRAVANAALNAGGATPPLPTPDVRGGGSLLPVGLGIRASRGPGIPDQIAAIAASQGNEAANAFIDARAEARRRSAKDVTIINVIEIDGFQLDAAMGARAERQGGLREQ